MLKKDLVINMPQMALEALSENWFFKELGDLHWKLICDGLKTKSFDLKNNTDDRLYATFVRIRFNCSKHLKSFKENQEGTIEGKIKRFGNSMYFSDINFKTNKEFIHAQLMTTFSIRNASDNTKLAKSEPSIGENEIENLSKLPSIGQEYRLLKKKILKELIFDNYHFPFVEAENPIFQTTYELNPYYDLNGVNLLYFAAYPIINDVCEAKYFNMIFPNFRWEQTYYTAYKDVFYYSNCNIQDKIIYKLLSYDQIDDNKYLITSLLQREGDGTIIAKIFSVKSKEE